MMQSPSSRMRSRTLRAFLNMVPFLLFLIIGALSVMGQLTQSGTIKGFEFSDVDQETNELRYTLTGDAEFGRDPNLLQLTGVRVVLYDSGQTNLVMNTSSALFNQRTKRATTDQKVVAVSDEARITGTGMDWDTGPQRLELKKDVEIELRDTGPLIQQPGEGEAAPDEGEAVEAGAEQPPQEPTLIHSQSMIYSMADNKITLSGGVTVEQGLSRLEAQAMTMTLEEEGQQARTIQADGAVSIFREDIEARGGQGFYDVQTRTIVLSDRPVVLRGRDRLECERLEWNAEVSRMIAYGKPKLILADAGTGNLLPKTELEGTRPLGEGQEAEEEKPSGPTLIISEELAFYPDENRAEFLGDVLVEGPAFQLGADRMDVYLTKTGNGEEDGEDSSSSQLQKVVADGFVELTQPGWRATGDHAEYNADPGNVVFRGDPVVRSGEDILSGDVIEVALEDSVLKCGPNARLWISDAGDTRTVLWAESGTAENTVPAPAADSEQNAGSGEERQAVARPIEIFSDQLEFRVLENRGRFLGNVRVTSADIRMQADRMDILLATIRDKRVLREVACFGQVKIIQGDRWATSDRARYDAFEEMVELLDHPQLTGKDWALTAQRITFYLNDDQLYAEPSPRLLAYPSEIPDWVLREQAKSQIEKTTGGEASETHLPIPGDQPTWTGEDQMRIGEVPSVRR